MGGALARRYPAHLDQLQAQRLDSRQNTVDSGLISHSPGQHRVIAIQLDVKTQRLRFLKTEAKSRAKLTAKVLAEARAGLDKDGGLPSAHALTFISERLVETKQDLPLADAIDDALLKHTIPPQSVTHLLFVFTGNAPEKLLTTALENYTGKIGQWGLGLHVDGHSKFIGAIYDKVIADAHKP